MFSGEVSDSSGTRLCPHCQEPVKVFLDMAVAALLFIPTVVILVLIKPTLVGFGVNEMIVAAAYCVVFCMLCARLKAG